MNNRTLFEPKLICPTCKSDEAARVLSFAQSDEVAKCADCSTEYPVVSGRPVLFDKSNALFGSEDYVDATGGNLSSRTWRRFVPSASTNLSAIRILREMATRLTAFESAVVLVVGGGRQREWLDPLISPQEMHRIIYCDVDKWADVDVFCDAHDLPFQTGSVDAVVTTAVLEHVLYPERVASEITRVLKASGLLYSELPFMQQVHEGAYDFTRYTMSGHRRLFNHFAEIESGLTSGPATALYWAIENFALSWTGKPAVRNAIKVLLRTLLFWVKYLDYPLKNKPGALDAASCTFFFGSKAQRAVPDDAIISGYKGSKAVAHV